MSKTNKIPALKHGGLWRAMIDGAVQIIQKGGSEPPDGYYDAGHPDWMHDFDIVVEDKPSQDAAVVVSRTTPRMSQAMVDRLVEKTK